MMVCAPANCSLNERLLFEKSSGLYAQVLDYREPTAVDEFAVTMRWLCKMLSRYQARAS